MFSLWQNAVTAENNISYNVICTVNKLVRCKALLIILMLKALYQVCIHLLLLLLLLLFIIQLCFGLVCCPV